MAKRIYVVKHGEKSRLIEAENKAQALSHAVKTSFKVELASQAELVELLQSGHQVEKVD